MGALPPPEATKAYAIGTERSNRPDGWAAGPVSCAGQLGQFGQAGQDSSAATGGASGGGALR